MESKGLILRIHGGATSLRNGDYKYSFLTRESHNQDEKRRIAKAAFDTIHEGDSILLDVGTTIQELAKLLTTKIKITVIVSSLSLAQTLATQPGIELIVIGGKYRRSEFSMVGHIADMCLKSFYVDKVFVGAAGIHSKSGITEFSYEQAGTKKTLIEQARQRIVLADHTKFDKTELAFVCPLSSIDRIITDSGLSDDIYSKYEDLDLEILRV
jgi:DeoR/GlpR family transcriptional regulator of sugar metabolism